MSELALARNISACLRQTLACKLCTNIPATLVVVTACCAQVAGCGPCMQSYLKDNNVVCGDFGRRWEELRGDPSGVKLGNEQGIGYTLVWNCVRGPGSCEIMQSNRAALGSDIGDTVLGIRVIDVQEPIVGCFKRVVNS